MKRISVVATVGLSLLIPALVAAQSSSGSRSGTQTSAPSGSQTSGTSGTQTSGSNQSGMGGGGWFGGENEWLGSAFVGSSFGAQDANQAGLDFGGSVGYLWRGAVGAEFQANFSPNFALDPTRSALLIGDEPWINTYMINALAALPIGSQGRFQPYVSGGAGAITLRSDTLLASDGTANGFAVDDTRGAGNLGAGFMGYMGNVGVRGDVRWFRGFNAGSGANNASQTAAEVIGRAVLSDLSFWRANVGLAFRW